MSVDCGHHLCLFLPLGFRVGFQILFGGPIALHRNVSKHFCDLIILEDRVLLSQLVFERGVPLFGFHLAFAGRKISIASTF